MNPSEILEDNKARIRHLTELFRERLRHNELETALRYASLLGSSAWLAHAGFYALPEMELALAEIAASSMPNSAILPARLPAAASDGRRMLHVVTTAYMTGGHTRLAERWMRCAPEGARQSCVLLNQEGAAYPRWLEEAARASGGDFVVCPNGVSLLDKSRWLRQLASAWADVVVLHTHPDDPVPNVAFGLPGGPPVLYVNHAAHTFWYGPNIADAVIDFREPEASMSRRRRYARRVEKIPMPLRPRSLARDRTASKLGLGIEPHRTVLLTIASAYKFVPFAHYRFQDAVAEALRRHDDCLLLVVGVYPDDPHWQEAIAKTDGRIRLYGLQPDLDLFYGAADLFLESFPFGSITAAMDAAMLGIPIVLAPKPIDPVLGLVHYDGMYPKPLTIEEYRDRLEALMGDRKARDEYGSALMASVRAHHDEASWRTRQAKLLDNLPITHATGMAAAPFANLETELDRQWARMQRFDGTHANLVELFEQFNRSYGGRE